MDLEQNDCKDDRLKQKLKAILANESLKQQRQWIKAVSSEFAVGSIDVAAALAFLTLHDQGQGLEKGGDDESKTPSDQSVYPLHFKLVRYRLDIGRIHNVSEDQIKAVLVDISGVDIRTIGKLDIRNHYTLVELPHGMPADIFQLLSETEINKQRLNIKRVKFQRRHHRRNNRKNS